MASHTAILHSASQRAYAHRLVDAAPVGSVVEVSAPKRSVEQNARLWALLSRISTAKPEVIGINGGFGDILVGQLHGENP